MPMPTTRPTRVSGRSGHRLTTRPRHTTNTPSHTSGCAATARRPFRRAVRSMTTRRSTGTASRPRRVVGDLSSPCSSPPMVTSIPPSGGRGVRRSRQARCTGGRAHNTRRGRIPMTRPPAPRRGRGRTGVVWIETGNVVGWWSGAGSNRRHHDFQLGSDAPIRTERRNLGTSVQPTVSVVGHVWTDLDKPPKRPNLADRALREVGGILAGSGEGVCTLWWRGPRSVLTPGCGDRVGQPSSSARTIPATSGTSTVRVVHTRSGSDRQYSCASRLRIEIGSCHG